MPGSDICVFSEMHDGRRVWGWGVGSPRPVRTPDTVRVRFQMYGWSSIVGNGLGYAIGAFEPCVYMCMWIPGVVQ